MLRAPSGVCPSIDRVPADGVSRPATTRSRVDLPQPDGPTSAMNSPGRRVRSIDSRAAIVRASSSKDFATPPTTTLELRRALASSGLWTSFCGTRLTSWHSILALVDVLEDLGGEHSCVRVDLQLVDGVDVRL